jgi:hypothetical protein
MADHRLKNLRGPSRRSFLRWAGAAAAAVALDRSRLLDFLSGAGGTALADDMACRTTNRSLHLVGGMGSFAWFQLLWPHLDVVYANNPAFAYHEEPDNTLFYTGDKPFAYAPEAPWIVGGIPARPMSAFMAGFNQSHTNKPSLGLGNGDLFPTLAAIQRETPCFLPVVGVDPVGYNTQVAGAPPATVVQDSAGLIGLFDSAASQLTLKSPENRHLYEKYYESILRLREGSARPTWTRETELTKKAVHLLGSNLAEQLTPSPGDLAAYGLSPLPPELEIDPGKDSFLEIGRRLIVTARAFKLGLANSVILPLCGTAVEPTALQDPHTAFDDLPRLRAVLAFLGKLLDTFYADLAAASDPTCPGKGIDRSVILTVHGDTPKDPLNRVDWPDGTPGGCNWLYVMGAGYLATGWFGGVKTNGTFDGFDPETGQDIPGPSGTAWAASAAVVYAVARGNMNKVREYYQGPDITGLVKPPPAWP